MLNEDKWKAKVEADRRFSRTRVKAKKLDTDADRRRIKISKRSYHAELETTRVHFRIELQDERWIHANENAKRTAKAT